MTEALRILIAEDDMLLAQLMQLQLQQAGHQADWVADGESAVSAALSYGYDLVLLDWQMPQMDGLQAAAMLRQLGYPRPLVLLSADNVESPLLDACLLKPFSADLLFAAVGVVAQKPISFVVCRDLKQQFVLALADIQRQLQQACQMFDETTIRALVHQIKGSAEIFGAAALSKEADQLQKRWQHQPVQPEQLSLLCQLIAVELDRGT